MRRFVLLLIVLSLAAARGQTADPSKLTLDRIFASADFRGDRVPAVKWLDKGEYTTLQPSTTHTGGRDLVRVDAAGKTEVLVPAAKLVPPGGPEPLSIDGYELSKDRNTVLVYTNSARVWRENTRGDYWTFHRPTGKLTKLGGPAAKPSSLMFAKLSPDASRVGYVRDNNLYVEPVAGGAPVSLTTDGTAQIINGTFDWVYEEEFACKDGWRWSPDGRHVAYWQLDTRGVKEFTLIDHLAGTYPVLKTFAYPKAGERNSACRVGVVPAGGGTTKWINVPGDTKTDFYIPRMAWAANPKELLIQRVNRLQNTIDVLLVNHETGHLRTVLVERDSAWVDLADDAGKWVEAGSTFTWISERDGWRHLYLVRPDGHDVRRVTPGDYDVIKVLYAEQLGRVYFHASPDDPLRQYLYATSMTGYGKLERLTPADQTGWHDYDISPDGGFAVHTFSTFDSPPRVELITLPDHKVVRVLAANDKLRETVGKLARTPVEFFRADAGDGVKLDGWLIKPPGFDPSKKYPLFFYVYGEPWGQEVTDRWHGPNYLWHTLLAQQGYVVACVDNRGTPCPRGRDWRKSVYRQIGTLASQDQVAAARELLKRPYLDAARVGVWGWSGGGSMTLNLLFRHPDVYKVGMSVAPVPDVHLYDTIYQERYMGLPRDNAADYKKASPVTHAAGLKGDLLIVHGTGDDNVHYQGVEQLADVLIGLNKPFTLMPYPTRSHSISEGRNTRRHLYALLTRYLKANLPAGGR